MGAHVLTFSFGRCSAVESLLDPVGGAEAVAHAGFSEQVAGVGWVVFKLVAQLCHVLAQVLGFPLVLLSPHLLRQVALAD